MIRLALERDLSAVDHLFMEVKRDLLAREIFQWDDQYPNTEFFTMAIEEEGMYLLTEEDEVIGAVVLDEWQPPEWETITWQRDSGQYLVIHSLAIHPQWQTKGLSKQILQFCEAFAREHHYDGIRLDAFSENPAALALYERSGYTRIGELSFPFKPVNHQVYYCYEKLF